MINCGVHEDFYSLRCWSLLNGSSSTSGGGGITGRSSSRGGSGSGRGRGSGKESGRSCTVAVVLVVLLIVVVPGVGVLSTAFLTRASYMHVTLSPFLKRSLTS